MLVNNNMSGSVGADIALSSGAANLGAAIGAFEQAPVFPSGGARFLVPACLPPFLWYIQVNP